MTMAIMIGILIIYLGVSFAILVDRMESYSENNHNAPEVTQYFEIQAMRVILYLKIKISNVYYIRK